MYKKTSASTRGRGLLESARAFLYNRPAHRGVVVQLVRTPACHAGGREFESRRPRHSLIKSAVLQSPLITEGGRRVKKYKQSLERRFCILKRRPPVPPNYRGGQEG